MKFWTKKGDGGKTMLASGEYVEKSSLQVEAYGTLDELGANIELAINLCSNGEVLVLENLQRLDKKLPSIYSQIAARSFEKFPETFCYMQEKDIEELQNAIDYITNQLPQLKFPVKNNKSILVAQLNICRTVCRRSERALWKFIFSIDNSELSKKDVKNSKNESSNVLETQKKIAKYINRASDLLFALACLANELV